MRSGFLQRIVLVFFFFLSAQTINAQGNCANVSLKITQGNETGKFIFSITSDRSILGTNFDISAIHKPWAYSSGTRWDWNGKKLDLTYKIPRNGPHRINLFLQFEYEPGKYCSVTLKDTVEVYGYACTSTISSAPSNFYPSTYTFSLEGENIGINGTGTTLWEFGDGSTSTQFKPTYTYQKAGKYTVKATRNYYGCTTVATYPLNICVDGPIPFHIERDIEPRQFKFAIESVDLINMAFWQIDSVDKPLWYKDYFGVNTNRQEVSYQFKEDGVYNIWAFVITKQGCFLEANTVLNTAEFEPGNVISGIVKADLSPVTDGVVLLFEEGEEDWTAVNYGNIENGKYMIEHVEPGTYLLYALPDPQHYSDFMPTYFVNAFAWEGAYKLGVTGNTEADITLIRLANEIPVGSGKISGAFVFHDKGSFEQHIYSKVGEMSADLTASGNAAFVPIYLLNENKEIIGWTITDQDGKYRFTDLPFGSYYVKVEKPSVTGESDLIVLSANTLEVETGEIEIIPDDLVTGIPDDEQGQHLIVYPNPSSGQVHFTQAITGTIYDSHGNVVTRLFDAHVTDLDVAGIYFLRSISGKATKIVISK